MNWFRTSVVLGLCWVMTGCTRTDAEPVANAVSPAGASVLVPACPHDPAIDIATDRQRTTSEYRASATSDWPQLFGPRGDSWSDELGLRWNWDGNGPPLLWKRPVGTGYSAPVLQDDRLILHQRIADDEVIECLAAETGERLWAARFPTSYACKYPYSHGPYATPTIRGDSVFAISAEGLLRRLSLKDGTLHWERDLLTDFQAAEGAFGVGTSPRIVDGRVVVNIGGKQDCGIVAVDAATGDTVWTATNDGRGYTTAVSATHHGEAFLYVMTEQGLVALDPANGDVRWQYPFGVQATAERVNAVTPLIVGDLVVLTTGPGPGTVVLQVRPDGTYWELWKSRRVLDAQYTNLLHVDGCLYGVTSRASAVLRCVDLRTGHQFWEHASDLCRANTLFVDQHILVLGEHGHLACFEPDRKEPRQLWMTEPLLETPCFSAPALSGGRLYLRNEQQVLCLDLRRGDS